MYSLITWLASTSRPSVGSSSSMTGGAWVRGRAGARLEEPRQKAQGGGLAGAVGAEQAVHSARLHRERQPIDREQAAAAGKRKSLGELLDGDHELIVCLKPKGERSEPLGSRE